MQGLLDPSLSLRVTTKGVSRHSGHHQASRNEGTPYGVGVRWEASTPVRTATTSSSNSSALRLMASLGRPPTGWEVNMVGYSGAPHMLAMALAVTLKGSVHIVAEGMPTFSR